jgi:hypothetical protein
MIPELSLAVVFESLSRAGPQSVEEPSSLILGLQTAPKSTHHSRLDYRLDASRTVAGSFRVTQV